LITITHEHSNIFLKQPKFDELDYVAWLWSDEETMASVGGIFDFPENKRSDWYRQMVVPGDGRNFYCLIYTNENEKIGEVSFHQYDDIEKSAHFNVKIAYEHRGQGYARQAVLLLLDYYFHMYGGETMLDDVAKSNDAAKQLLIKCGFEEISSNEGVTLFSITKDRFDELFSE
jgi:RimJ/RimL family protein N-acetyltransferase